MSLSTMKKEMRISVIVILEFNDCVVWLSVRLLRLLSLPSVVILDFQWLSFVRAVFVECCQYFLTFFCFKLIRTNEWCACFCICFERPNDFCLACFESMCWWICILLVLRCLFECCLFLTDSWILALMCCNYSVCFDRSLHIRLPMDLFLTYFWMFVLIVDVTGVASHCFFLYVL